MSGEMRCYWLLVPAGAAQGRLTSAKGRSAYNCLNEASLERASGDYTPSHSRMPTSRSIGAFTLRTGSNICAELEGQRGRRGSARCDCIGHNPQVEPLGAKTSPTPRVNRHPQTRRSPLLIGDLNFFPHTRLRAKAQRRCARPCRHNAFAEGEIRDEAKLRRQHSLGE